MFILGVQRSGTTMLTNCLEKSLEMEVYGEASKAMENWRLRDDETVKKSIKASRCKAIIFKPLTESHRATELMSLSPDSVVCWIFRRPADRANSAVARFGTINLEHLSAFVKGERMETWQAQGLTQKNSELLRSFNYENMLPHTAAGLFWYIRNSLYFDQKLDTLDNVLPLAYEDLVESPEEIMRGLCRFLACNFSAAMIRDIHEKSIGRSPPKVADEVEALCLPMYQKLHDIQKYRWRTLDLGK